MHEETPVRRESVSHQGIPYTPKSSKENVSRSSSARKQGKHSTMMEHAADYRPVAAVAVFGLHILQLLLTKIYVL